jgi:ribosome biogenesis GTPase
MDRDRKGRAQQWIDLYRGIGYEVIPTSTKPGQTTDDAFARIATLLHDNRTVLCGLSGVGKSTLLNTVVPDLDLRVGSLSHIRQGKHTTSHTQLIPLPGGGHVLDTPGVRSFHLFHAGSQELQFLFPEIGELLPQCDYRNCLHLDEPGCAVRAALGDDRIAHSRYRSYCYAMATALQGEGRSMPRVDLDDDDEAEPRQPTHRPRPTPRRR